MGNILDRISEEKLFELVNSFVVYTYGKELTMVENKEGYLRFFGKGPEPPYHRNLSGRLWVDDDRVVDLIKNYLVTDLDEACAILSFYISEKYQIKVTDAKYQPHSGWFDIDYDQFDNEDFVIDDDDDYY